MALFFTGDLHLGHTNAIEFTNRPFSDVDDTNRQPIDDINSVVGVNDELWIGFVPLPDSRLGWHASWLNPLAWAQSFDGRLQPAKPLLG